jgi:hypothetical protein
MVCSHSELIWKSESYEQSVGLLARVVSSTQGRLPTQDNTNRKKKKTQTCIHIASGIRTHGPSVGAEKYISCLRPHDHCDRPDASGGIGLQCDETIHLPALLVEQMHMCKPLPALTTEDIS